MVLGILVSHMQAGGQEGYGIPSWIKKDAKWWSEGKISDYDYFRGMQYLIKIGVLKMPAKGMLTSGTQFQTPGAVKDEAGLWVKGQISDGEFVNGIQYMVQNKLPPSSMQDITNGSELAVTNMTKGRGQALSDSYLLAIAGNQYSDGNVPLGDGKYVTTGPKKGYIYLCNVPPLGEGARVNGPWIHGNTWNFHEKLSVGGSVSWPDASFTDVVSDGTRYLSGNGLPVGNTTGIFPISLGDAVGKYDKNPNSISPQAYDLALPVTPQYSETPYCVRGEVGMMLTGIPLFDGFDAELRDAPAHEAQDWCDGHPQSGGQYHYHGLSSCFEDVGEKTVLGYALDGFPITGPEVAEGKYLTTDDLDECHGITSEIMQDGVPTVTYHYVMTFDFPYSASCFRGKPVEYIAGSGHAGQNVPPQGMPNQGVSSQGGSPPQEAVNACLGKSSGNPCSFTSQRGYQISGMCQVTPASLLACVPH